MKTIKLPPSREDLIELAQYKQYLAIANEAVNVFGIDKVTAQRLAFGEVYRTYEGVSK